MFGSVFLVVLLPVLPCLLVCSLRRDVDEGFKGCVLGVGLRWSFGGLLFCWWPEVAVRRLSGYVGGMVVFSLCMFYVLW